MISSENQQVSAALETWYQHRNGPYVLAGIQRALEPILDVAFGYHILQMGVCPKQELFDHSPINHRIYSTGHGGRGIGLIADNDELPFESDSIDTVIAHHALEFGPNPHSVLREIQRVLAPQGHLLIVGFNPYSLFGLSTYFRRLVRNPLWQHHRPLSVHRLTDWLHLLGCEVSSCNFMYALPPFGGGRVHAALGRADAWSNENNLPAGGLYVLHAIKQVSALHRPRPGLRERGGRLIGLAVPKRRPVPSPAPAVPGHNQLVKSSGDNSS